MRNRSDSNGVKEAEGRVGIAWPLRLCLMTIFTALVFSSCTCQRDVPEPPERSSRVPRTRKAWEGKPKRKIVKKRSDLLEKEIEREHPTAAPTKEVEEPGQRGEEEVELPDDFPSDIPVVADAEVFGVQKLPAGAKNVLFRTDKNVSEVFNYYRNSMGGGGWNVEQEYEREGQSFLSFKKGDTITNMTVARDPKTGKQVIAVMYYDEEPLPFPEF